ncbi:MAG: Fused nickel transport protein NikMN [Syntrophomonadaceae bacterium]|nr:Fused nickel transport protein NikMN [Bacillota bacterium]
MHISDGVLSPQVWISGYVITMALTAYVLARKTDTSELPKLSIITAALFVASLIHIPIGPTSVHLVLTGLAGITLGLLAFPAVLVALILQALLFQHGGITTIGINTINLGLPALAVYGLFLLGTRTNIRGKHGIFGGLAGGMAVALGILLLSLSLLVTGEHLKDAIPFVVVAHLPLIAIEAIVVGAFAGFVTRVSPQVLKNGRVS